ncbi:hypothetical protein UT300018_04710 [Clostridium faecium]|uniref:Uncharacterized protein n=1 Tax=Clostridium faecium TaxID=2762223 RepID=A0ABR8YWE8_9CLOT|nr:hypothetical protein [Clostridium faecium]MBD8048602.1 hypothetical protein [Clostridium faecium]
MKDNVIYVDFQAKSKYKLKPKLSINLIIFHLKSIFKPKNKKIPSKVQIYKFRKLP